VAGDGGHACDPWAHPPPGLLARLLACSLACQLVPSEIFCASCAARHNILDV